MVFFDNTTLLDDITYVDRLVTDYQSQTLITQPDQPLQSLQNNQTLEFDYQINVLLVADYSMYQKFNAIYKNNTGTAYLALREYLEAIFDQVILTCRSKINPTFWPRSQLFMGDYASLTTGKFICI